MKKIGYRIRTKEEQERYPGTLQPTLNGVDIDLVKWSRLSLIANQKRGILTFEFILVKNLISDKSIRFSIDEQFKLKIFALDGEEIEGITAASISFDLNNIPRMEISVIVEVNQ